MKELTAHEVKESVKSNKDVKVSTVDPQQHDAAMNGEHRATGSGQGQTGFFRDVHYKALMELLGQNSCRQQGMQVLKLNME